MAERARTIVIVGGNARVASATIPLLKDNGWRVVALVRAGEAPGAYEVVRDWLQADRLPELLATADAVLNLTGDINPPRGADYAFANSRPAARLAAAIAPGRVPYAVFISFPNAAAGAANAFLRAKGEAERHTQRLAERSLILRVSSILGTAAAPLEFETNLMTPLGKPGQAFGTGKTRLRPVLLEDVARVIATALEARLEGTFALQGPETFTLDDFIRLVNRDPAKPMRHVPGPVATLLAPLIGMRRDMVRLFLADQLDPSPDAHAALGVVPPPVSAAWSPN